MEVTIPGTISIEIHKLISSTSFFFNPTYTLLVLTSKTPLIVFIIEKLDKRKMLIERLGYHKINPTN